MGTTIIAIILALVIAGLVAGDAQKRNMNHTGWFIFTFLLMIIALPIYFIVRKPKVTQPKQGDIIVEEDDVIGDEWKTSDA